MKQIFIYLCILIGIFLSVNIEPSLNETFDANFTSSSGIFEFVVLLIHFILGLTSYFVILLFKRNNNNVYLLLLTLFLYFSFLDYPIFYFGTYKMKAIVIIMRILQLSIMLYLNKKGKVHFNFIICLIFYFALLVSGSLMGFRFVNMDISW